ncbi:galactosyltransferase-related protein [Micromonospora sp. NPDC052213]|uniref:glycosyltransferase family 2 protein n=1 Tax=Micromonospora sp. NPDC052213 TaxID=3155812 RepID=UPI00343EFEEA
MFTLLDVGDGLQGAVEASCRQLDRSVRPDAVTKNPSYRQRTVWDVWDVRNRFEAIEAASGVHRGAFARDEYMKCIAEGDSVSPWLSFLTSHSSTSRELCRSVGAFDERFRGWGEEDAELGFRLWQGGGSFDALDDTPVCHQVHPRPAKEEIRSWFTNYVQVAEKHSCTGWYLRWRIPLGYMTALEYEKIMRAVLAGDTDREAQIERRYRSFVRIWPSTGYGGLLKNIAEKSMPMAART